MKRPWAGKTGLAKATAIFAALALVSLGLCGANFVAVILYVPLGGPGAHPGEPEPSQWLGSLLGTTGFLELAGIVVGLVGTVVVLLIQAARGDQ